MRAEELNRFFKWVVISVLVFHPMVPTASHRFFSRNHRAVSPRASPSAAFMRELYAPGSLFTSRQRSNSSPIDLSTAKSKSMSLKLALMNPPPLLLCIFLKDKIYWLFSFLFFLSRNCSCSNCADWTAKLKSRVWRKSTRSFSPVPICRPRSSRWLGCKLAEMRP